MVAPLVHGDDEAAPMNGLRAPACREEGTPALANMSPPISPGPVPVGPIVQRSRNGVGGGSWLMRAAEEIAAMNDKGGR